MDKIDSRMVEKAEEMEVLSNKVTELIQTQEEQKNKELEKLVDMNTPHRHRFLIRANTITLQ